MSDDVSDDIYPLSPNNVAPCRTINDMPLPSRRRRIVLVITSGRLKERLGAVKSPNLKPSSATRNATSIFPSSSGYLVSRGDGANLRPPVGRKTERRWKIPTPPRSPSSYGNGSRQRNDANWKPSSERTWNELERNGTKTSSRSSGGRMPIL